MSTSTLLMLGDSLVDYGNWRSLLPQYKVISQGRPGEQTKELLWRLSSCSGHKSVDAILIMTGTNDLFTGHTDFTKEIRTITASLQEIYPGAIILLNSLLPIKVPGFQETIRNVNRDLQAIASATGAFYFDLYTPFEKASEPLFDFDGVHLSSFGYVIWARLLSSELRTLLAKDSD
jgi:lysophospholipase L1-like esterase